MLLWETQPDTWATQGTKQLKCVPRWFPRPDFFKPQFVVYISVLSQGLKLSFPRESRQKAKHASTMSPFLKGLHSSLCHYAVSLFAPSCVHNNERRLKFQPCMQGPHRSQHLIYIMMQWVSVLSEACEYVPYGADGTRLQHDREGSLMELWQAFSHPVPDRGHTTGCSCVLFFVTVKASWIIPPVLEWAIWMIKFYDFSRVQRQTWKQFPALAHLAYLDFATCNLATCFHDLNLHFIALHCLQHLKYIFARFLCSIFCLMGHFSRTFFQHFFFSPKP